jgi:hypothetical protein
MTALAGIRLKLFSVRVSPSQLQVLLQGLPGAALEVAQGAVQGTAQTGSSSSGSNPGCGGNGDSSRRSSAVLGSAQV